MKVLGEQQKCKNKYNFCDFRTDNFTLDKGSSKYAVPNKLASPFRILTNQISTTENKTLFQKFKL